MLGEDWNFHIADTVLLWTLWIRIWVMCGNSGRMWLWKEVIESGILLWQFSFGTTKIDPHPPSFVSQATFGFSWRLFKLFVPLLPIINATPSAFTLYPSATSLAFPKWPWVLPQNANFPSFTPKATLSLFRKFS